MCNILRRFATFSGEISGSDGGECEDVCLSCDVLHRVAWLKVTEFTEAIIAMMMEAVIICEPSANCYHIVRCKIPKDSRLYCF
jgi:hypothetical protein